MSNIRLMPSRSLAALLTATLAAALLALPAAAEAEPEAGWYRIQLTDRAQPGDRQALTALGADALLYAPDDAYLAWLDPAAADAVAGLDRVGAVRALRWEDKLDQALRDAHGPLRTEVTVYGAEADAASLALTAFGVVAERYPAQADGKLEILAVDVHAGALVAAASVPEVLHVGPGSTGLFAEDEGTAQVLANRIDLDARAPASPGYPEFLDEIGLDGEGVTVSILDTGVDPRHPDLAGRVSKPVDYGRAPEAGEPVDSYGHGTHVAGIVAGDPTALPALGVVRDSDGYAYGQGIAPKAHLIDQNGIAVTSGSSSWEERTRDALRAGAVAWNASLHSGEGTGVGYIASARTQDVLVRDGDFETEGNQRITLVYSSGNEGSAPQTMTSPKEAKNIITVGSTQSHRAGDIDRISGFSSRGPAVDGRILPTVVAPGERVASASALPASAVSALCLGPLPDAFGLYITCSGTSMAAPHVTGSVALIHQWWRRAFDDADPSPAMSKALLVNTAQPLRRSWRPDNNQGWGRVNLEALFDPTASRVYVDEHVVLTEPDETFTLDVEVDDPSRPLAVSLVWTDAPGAPGADPALVNDLDLVVEGPDGTVWYGNNLDRNWSVAGGDPDRLNNLENVFLEVPKAGGYRITVRAHNLPEPAIPGYPSEVNQDFALVVSNATAF